MERDFHLMPERIRALPRDERGFPVPKFVRWIDGKPDFRIVDSGHWGRCATKNSCWICGQPMGTFKCFVIGPMCAINRVSSEPPSHHECAQFAARNCPFLSHPIAKRRTDGLPPGIKEAPGHAIARNPGACAAWTTKSFRVFRANQGGEGCLIEIGPPEKVEWFAQGRVASRDEVLASIDSGMPILQSMAEAEGPESVRDLTLAIAEAMKLLPPMEEAPA